MQEAVLSPLATWQNFYVLIGSASGLDVRGRHLDRGGTVRMSSVRASGGIATFSTPTVVHFCIALLVATILSTSPS
jgi:hypothetical protein